MPRSHRRLVPPAALAALCAGALLAPAAATAATRYASPGGTGSTCTAAAPCAVDQAVSGAVSGDDVVLASGDYAVATALKATVPVTVEGTPGQPRPRLLGATSLAADTLTLSGGGTARHLEIDAAAGSSGGALRLIKANGEDLVVVSSSAGGPAVTLRTAPTTTLLRDAVVRCLGCGGAAIAFSDNQQGGNGVAVAVGVSATATGGAAAVTSDVQNGSASIVDVALSGDGGDVKAADGARVHASYSAFRADGAKGVADDGGNVGAPAFADVAAGDLHEAAGSPTIDAGTADSRGAATDLDGNPRTLGRATDIGAYETAGPDNPLAPPTMLGTTAAPAAVGTAPAAGPGALGGSLAPAGTPVLGRSVAVGTAAGSVLVRLPGSARPVALDDAMQLPLGAEIDARRGTVRLTSATSARAAQTGLFSGSRFRVRQTAGAHPLTQLVLSGEDFSHCPKAGAARAAAKGPHRDLWGRDSGGRFATIGRVASATVRGTRWLTSDSCSGTRVTVAQGAVVVRPTHGGGSVLVRAGHSHLVARRS